MYRPRKDNATLVYGTPILAGGGEGRGSRFHYTQQKMNSHLGSMKTALNNILLPTLFKVVNNIVQHCYSSLQASSGSTTCSVLLTTLNNVGSKTLFNAIFIRPEQVIHFWLCKSVPTCYKESLRSTMRQLHDALFVEFYKYTKRLKLIVVTCKQLCSSKEWRVCYNMNFNSTSYVVRNMLSVVQGIQ